MSAAVGGCAGCPPPLDPLVCECAKNEESSTNGSFSEARRLLCTNLPKTQSEQIHFLKCYKNQAWRYYVVFYCNHLISIQFNSEKFYFTCNYVSI